MCTNLVLVYFRKHTLPRCNEINDTESRTNMFNIELMTLCIRAYLYNISEKIPVAANIQCSDIAQ